jgi:hypothetical protein
MGRGTEGRLIGVHAVKLPRTGLRARLAIGTSAEPRLSLMNGAATFIVIPYKKALKCFGEVLV